MVYIYTGQKAMNTMSMLRLLILAAISLTVAVAAVAGEEKTVCPGAPSMTVEAACRKASGTQAMYDLCNDALAAAKGALASEEATMDAAIKLLLYNSSLSGQEREAYMECVEAYTTAEQAMWQVEDRLPRCSFGGLGNVYMNGLLDLESCRNRVLRLPPSPLYGMVVVDWNKAALAFFLGKLLGI